MMLCGFGRLASLVCWVFVICFVGPLVPVDFVVLQGCACLIVCC